MKIAKLLIITPFVFHGLLPGNRYVSVASCEKIKVDYEVVHSVQDLANGRILFRFEENRSNFHIYLLKARGKEVLPKSQTELSQLPPGKYVVVITGTTERSNYCPEFFEIEVKQV